MGSFEQHPELFWGIVTIISFAGGMAGSVFGTIVARHKKAAERWHKR